MRRTRSPARESTNGRKPAALQSECTGRSWCTSRVTSAQPSASRWSRSSGVGSRALALAKPVDAAPPEELEADADADVEPEAEAGVASVAATVGADSELRPPRSVPAGGGGG